MRQVIQLTSCQDASVNFVRQHDDGGFFESRYVQRTPDYFIVYLSSQTGCNMSCRFCHLTASKQTMMSDANLEDFIEQAKPAIAHYHKLLAKGMQPATKMHFNFMARGEPMLNQVMQKEPHKLFDALKALLEGVDVAVEFKISSILPIGMDESAIAKISDYPGAMIYYSLYSLDPKFRKRWIPKSLHTEHALDLLAATGKPVAIHWAFIEGQNDTKDGVRAIVEAVSSRGIQAKYNVVRYNPFSESQGKESEESLIEDLFQIMKAGTPAAIRENSRIVPRVGFDVKASCGMFVTGV